MLDGLREVRQGICRGYWGKRGVEKEGGLDKGWVRRRREAILEGSDPASDTYIWWFWDG